MSEYRSEFDTPPSSNTVEAARRELTKGYPNQALSYLERAGAGNRHATPDTMMGGSEPGANELYFACDLLLGVFDTDSQQATWQESPLVETARPLIEESISSMRERRDMHLDYDQRGVLGMIRRRMASRINEQIERGEAFLEATSTDDQR